VTERVGSALTDALLRPLGGDRVDAAGDAAWSEEIAGRLAQLAGQVSGRGPLRLTDFTVRTALAPGGEAPRAPFAWSAGTARRTLGLVALRALVAGAARTPTDGVGAAIGQTIRLVQEEQRPVSGMDRWLAGLSGAARAAVQAEAVTWTTRLWSALDWRAFSAPPAIGRDHWWDSPHSSLLAIRSRAEVRTLVPDPEGGRQAPAHLVVLGGPRRASVRSELSVVALVEWLRTADQAPPARIVGWWPDSGHLVTVEADRATLELGTATVARTLASLQAPNSRWEGPRRAAA
jgi:hypothetical protein